MKYDHLSVPPPRTMWTGQSPFLREAGMEDTVRDMVSVFLIQCQVHWIYLLNRFQTWTLLSILHLCVLVQVLIFCHLLCGSNNSVLFFLLPPFSSIIGYLIDFKWRAMASVTYHQSSRPSSFAHCILVSEVPGKTQQLSSTGWTHVLLKISSSAGHHCPVASRSLSAAKVGQLAHMDPSWAAAGLCPLLLGDRYSTGVGQGPHEPVLEQSKGTYIEIGIPPEVIDSAQTVRAPDLSEEVFQAQGTFCVAGGVGGGGPEKVCMSQPCLTLNAFKMSIYWIKCITNS